MSLVWRLAYRIYRFLSGVRYSTRRRFTSAGLMVMGGLFVTGLLGPDTENSVAYQAFTLLLAMLLLAVVASWFFRARFSATRLLPRFGTAGSPLTYTVRVKNLTGKIQSGLALLDELADPRPSFEEWRAHQRAEEKKIRSFRVSQVRRMNPFKVAQLKESTVGPVPPGKEVDARVELTPLRRGLLRFSGVTLARPDPLGLYRGLAKLSLAQTALILPKRYPLPPIALPGTMKYQQGGVALASHVGQSEEFVALRDYRHGDPVRHIHWRSWARAGKPVVKEFEDEFFVRHALVLDTFIEEPYSEVFEEAVSVAASFACTIQTQESLLDLLFVGPQSYCFTAGRGLAHADQMLEILASVRPCHDREFESLENLVLEHISSVSGCICVMLAWDAQRREFVKKLQLLGLPLLVLVITAPGRPIKLDPGPMASEPGRFRVLEVGRIEKGLAQLR